MYQWRIERLKAELAEAPLSEGQVLPYFILYVLMMTAVMYVPLEKMNVWNYLSCAQASVLSIFGTLYLFRKNGGNAGVHFFQRYFAVGWVVAIRWTVFMLPMYLIFRGVMDLPEEFSGLDFASLALMELVLYQRIGHHIADVAARARE
jgi:hypothetical protein